MGNQRARREVHRRGSSKRALVDSSDFDATVFRATLVSLVSAFESMRRISPKVVTAAKSVPLVTAFALCALSAFLSTSAAAAPPAELGELKGKVVLVDFWASWCVPCRHSFPWMNQMQQKYGAQGLQIIGVNLDDMKSAADKFLRETPAKFTLKFDPAGALARKFDVQTMPSSYVLDAAGNVIAKHFGFKLGEADEYEAQIRAALASH